MRADLADLPTYRPGRAVAASGSFKCSSNELPFPPLPPVVAAVAEAAGQMNRYPDMASSLLVDALAARHGVPVEHVVCGPGSVGVLQQLVAAVAAPGDEVVMAWRSFEAYPIVVAVAGATAVPVPLTSDGRHDVEAMAGAVTPLTRAVLVCSPNNPTGPVVSADELAWLLDAVPDEVLVVVDEAYAELVRDPQAADGLALARERPTVAALRTFSKAYGLAGLRVGYGVMAPSVAQALRATSIPFGVSSVAQAAALAALSCEAELLARVERVAAERVRVLGELRALGWQPPASEANFVWLPLGDRAVAFAQACEAQGVAVRTFPGEGVRVTVAEPEASDRVLAVAAGFPPGALPPTR